MDNDTNWQLEYKELPGEPGWYYELWLDPKTGGSRESCLNIALPCLVVPEPNVFYAGPLPRPAKWPQFKTN